MGLRNRALAAALLLTAPAVLCETPAAAIPSPPAAPKVDFIGAAPYSNRDLLNVLALHAGKPLTDADIQAATQRLSNTGLFDSVAVNAIGEGSTRQLRYTLKPTPDDKLLPLSFINFVWFSPAELDRTLRARVPLYHGALPPTGTVANDVQSALQQFLHEHSIEAALTHTVVEPTTAHPQRVVSFRIVQPSVVLSTLKLIGMEGLPADQQASVQQSLSALSGKPYNEGRSGITTEEALLAPAHNLGYITASVDHLQRTVIHTQRGYEVSLTANLIPGPVYTLSQLLWKPTPAYSAEDFSYDISRHSKETLHPGNVASQQALTYTELQVANVYHLLGYLDAYIDSIPVLDTTAHTVAYKLSVVPGQPYRLHALALPGIPSELAPVFYINWTLHPGDLYSAPYVVSWLKDHVVQPDFDKYAVSYQASADPNTHLVDLSITFVTKARGH